MYCTHLAGGRKRKLSTSAQKSKATNESSQESLASQSQSTNAKPKQARMAKAKEPLPVDIFGTYTRNFPSAGESSQKTSPTPAATHKAASNPKPPKRPLPESLFDSNSKPEAARKPKRPLPESLFDSDGSVAMATKPTSTADAAGSGVHGKLQEPGSCEILDGHRKQQQFLRDVRIPKIKQAVPAETNSTSGKGGDGKVKGAGVDEKKWENALGALPDSQGCSQSEVRRSKLRETRPLEKRNAKAQKTNAGLGEKAGVQSERKSTGTNAGKTPNRKARRMISNTTPPDAIRRQSGKAAPDSSSSENDDFDSRSHVSKSAVSKATISTSTASKGKISKLKKLRKAEYV